MSTEEGKEMFVVRASIFRPLVLLLALVGCGAAEPSRPIPRGPSSALPEAPLRFFPALASSRTGDAFRLWSLGHLIMVTAETGPVRFALIDGDEVRARTDMSSGLPATISRIVHVAGHLPDAVWIVTRDLSYPTPELQMQDEIYRFRGARWHSVERAPADQSYLAVWEAPEGCLVGIRGASGTDGALPVQRATVRAVDCQGHLPAIPGPKQSSLARGYDFVVARGISYGDLVTLAEPYAPGTPPLLEIWPHDGPKTRVSTVPVPEEALTGEVRVGYSVPRLFVRQSSEIYVAINFTSSRARRWFPPIFARFDGKAWSRLDLPPNTEYADLQMADDGSLLLIAAPQGDMNTLWGRRPGGAWASIGPLPADPETGKPYVPQQILARSLDDVWVVGRGRRGDVVFHNRPLRSPVTL